MDVNLTVETLLKDLKNPVWQQRDRALKSFLNLQDESLIRPLFEAVRNESIFIQRQFCRWLGNFGHPDGIPFLMWLLASDVPELRKEAGAALDKINSEQKYDELLFVLNSPNDFVRHYAVEALGKGRQINAVVPLMAQLNTLDTELEIKVINSLRLIDDKRAVKSIRALLVQADAAVPAGGPCPPGAGNPSVISAAIFALVELDKEHLLLLIEKLLWHVSPLVCQVTAWAIGEIRNPKGIPILTRRLGSPITEPIRQEIIRSLVKLEAQEQLITLAAHTDDINVRRLSHMVNEFRQPADVCLIVEGSYPYVKGGVADWVQALIKGLPELRFSVLHIASFQSDFREFKYILPDNLIGIREIYIHDGQAEPKSRLYDDKAWAVLEKLLTTTIASEDLDEFLDAAAVISDQDLIYSPKIWHLLERIYQSKMPPGTSFPDFFWTYRSIVLPLLQLRKQVIPPAQVYHALSTGYSGVVGSLAKRRTGGRLMLTEHGIYHRERRIEIEKLDWIYTDKTTRVRVKSGIGALKDVWISFFNMLSRIAYHYSDRIITLYEDNRRCQLEMGAAADQARIIANGVELEKFSAIKPKAGKKTFTVGLAGRVVPIKDIKSFIRAAKTVSERMPQAEFLVMGSTEEDPEYAADCIEFAQLLELDRKLKFTGDVNLLNYYPLIDVLVLTSISESQPLVILEAMACGIPVVANNVGSCLELILGKDKEDQAIGPAGIVSFSSNPTEIAEAIVSISQNQQLRRDMAQAGRTRVARYYQQRQVVENYRNAYKELMNS